MPYFNHTTKSAKSPLNLVVGRNQNILTNTAQYAQCLSQTSQQVMASVMKYKDELWINRPGSRHQRSLTVLSQGTRSKYSRLWIWHGLNTLKKLKEDIHDGEMYSHTSGQESVHTTDLPEEKQYKSGIRKMTGHLKGFTAEGNARECTALQQTNRRSAKLTRGHSRWWKPKSTTDQHWKKKRKKNHIEA